MGWNYEVITVNIPKVNIWQNIFWALFNTIPQEQQPEWSTEPYNHLLLFCLAQMLAFTPFTLLYLFINLSINKGTQSCRSLFAVSEAKL